MHGVHYNFESVHLQVSRRGPVPIDVLRANLPFLQKRFQKVLTSLADSTFEAVDAGVSFNGQTWQAFTFLDFRDCAG